MDRLFNELPMGLQPTKSNQDAAWRGVRSGACNPACGLAFSQSSRLKGGNGHEWSLRPRLQRSGSETLN